MARMAGNLRGPWCPHCNAKPGLDCPDVWLDPRKVRRLEKAETRRLARDAHVERESTPEEVP